MGRILRAQKVGWCTSKQELFNWSVRADTRPKVHDPVFGATHPPDAKAVSLLFEKARLPTYG